MSRTESYGNLLITLNLSNMTTTDIRKEISKSLKGMASGVEFNFKKQYTDGDRERFFTNYDKDLVRRISAIKARV